jgi:hypothetical protein
MMPVWSKGYVLCFGLYPIGHLVLQRNWLLNLSLNLSTFIYLYPSTSVPR